MNQDVLTKKQSEPIDPKTALNYSDVPFGDHDPKVVTVDPKTVMSPSDIPFGYSEGRKEYSDIDVNEYDKYLGTVYTGLGRDYLDKARAQKQSATEQFVGFINQALIGEIVGGTLEGIGYLFDVDQYGALLSGTEKEFGNWFSDIGKSLRTWTEEATPIYRDPDAPKFDPGSFSWWMQNGKSIASTVSLMVPSGAAVRGLKAVGTALGAWQKLFPKAQWVARGVSQAAISRHMENLMEASGTYEELYKKGIQKGMSNEDATEYASRGASTTYSLNWAMFLQDLPQYLLFNRAWGKASVGLADKSIGAAMAMGHKLAPVIGSKAAAIGWDMLGEGFEEGYQFIAAEEAKYLADKFEDPSTTSSFDKRLGKYLQDGELWTSVTMGAIGAGVMQTAGKAINNLIVGGDPQTKFVKEFGAKISHAAQQVYFADIIGSESAKRSAILNLFTTLASKSASLGQLDDFRELIKRSAEATEEDIQRFGLTPESIELMKENAPEILKNIDEFEKRWETNSKKYEPERVPEISIAEVLVDNYNEYKKDYSKRLNELKDNVTNYNSLSLEAQNIFELSSKIIANNKKIAFQKKRLEDKENPLSKKQIDLANKLITDTEANNTKLKTEIEKLDKSRDDDTRKEDDSLDIGGPYNLLNAKSEKDITGHAILEYLKLDEALAFADDTLKFLQKNLKDLLSKKPKGPKPRDKEEFDRIPEEDDYVLYTKDRKQFTGIVDYVNADGDYVIIPTTKWSTDSKYATKPTGESVIISKDKVVLDSKQYAEEDINNEPLSEDDIPTVREVEDTSNAYLDVAYMFDGGGDKPTITNEDLHRYLVNPKNSVNGVLEGIVAEMHIDITSDYAKKYWTDKGISDIELRKISSGKLTDNDINELQAKVGFDTMPISIILVKDGKVLFKGGMYYHNVSFKEKSVPQYIKDKGEDAIKSYVEDRKHSIRKARFNILTNLLKGNEVYSDTLRINNGHYNNSKERGNVLKRHNLSIDNSRLAVSRKNGKIYTSQNSIVAGVTATTAGNVFAPTRLTIDGKEAWAKVNPTKLTTEHAEILWEAINTRYLKGSNAKLDEKLNVTGLNAGEVIQLLTLFGERKTNIDHPDFKGEKRADLKNKTLYVHSGSKLTFGITSDGEPRTVNLYEDDINIYNADKAAFIKWATENKNYTMPISIKPMGLDMNSPLTKDFKIGSWENKAIDGKYLTLAQFLMSVPVDGKNKFAVESDLQEYENTGSAFVRPNLYLGDTMNAIKIKIKSKQKPIVPKETDKSKKTKRVISKVNKTQTIDSPLDLINLPIGANIYYIQPEFTNTDGDIVPEEKRIIAEVIFDKKFGKVLDLRKIAPKSPQNYWKWGEMLLLEQEDAIKDADGLVSYLKGRPHINKLFVDISNIVEDKVQVEETNEIKKVEAKLVDWKKELELHPGSNTAPGMINIYTKELEELKQKETPKVTVPETKEQRLRALIIARDSKVGSKNDLGERPAEQHLLEDMYQAPEGWFLPENMAEGKKLANEMLAELKQISIIPPTSTETVDSLEDFFGIPMEATFFGEIKSPIDLPKEIKWLHEKFGKQNIEETDKLIRISKDGRKAFSIFTSDCIYIFKGAPEGALYHEAFHRVFLGYLSEEDRQEVYKSARKQYGDLTENELSERLAEEFRAYKLAGIKPKSRTIWKFFSDLFNFIVTFFTGQTKLTSFEIERLFESIERGQFRYSKISAENHKRLEGIQTPMAVEIQKTSIPYINNYHTLDKIVKYLSAILIQVNEVDNLNDVKNIDTKKLKNKLEEMILRLSNMIANTQKLLDDNLIPADQIEDKKNRLQVSYNFRNVLETVLSKEFSSLFMDKISDQLRKLNVRRIVDEEDAIDDIDIDNYRGAFDKRASYEINSKDNILASVKFLIATLPENKQLDPVIGIPEFVDFNEIWNSLMHNLYDISNVDEMMNRLQNHSDKYPYEVLINKLEADTSGILKQQLRTAVMKHRHDFINFLVTLSKDGIPTVEITNADVSSAAKRLTSQWNWFFYSASGAADVSASGVIINEKFTESIYNEYKNFASKVEREYSKNKLFGDTQSVISDFVSILNKIGVHVDNATIDKYLEDRSTENKDENLFQMISNDFTYIFNKVKNVSDSDVRTIFDDEKNIRSLGNAYASTHPEIISDTILGPSNHMYFVYAQNSYISDKVRRFRNDKSYLEDHLNKIYNDNSYFGKQLLDSDAVRQKLEIFTFSMFSERGDSGMDYLDINPIEDYIFKLSAMYNGIVPFPTMADRKTYYLLKGLKPFDFNYNVTDQGTFLPEEAINILLGYAKSERKRIEEAKKVIREYNDIKATGDETSIRLKEKQLIEGYHYKLRGKEKDTNLGNALLYHNFPSFNREGFDFDAEARNEIRKSITENIRQELEYAESLGIIRSHETPGSTKKQYSNLLIDSNIISKESEKFGSESMAIKNIIASNFINTTIANAESEKLFSGDPAFYKLDKDTQRVVEDKMKRLTVLASTGDNFANSVKEQGLNEDSFKIATIATQKYQSIYYKELFKWHYDVHERRIKKDNPEMSDKEVTAKAEAITSDSLRGYREMDPTDGQAWISPDMYRSLSIRLGEWSNDKQKAFELLQSDRKLSLEEEQQALKITFQPLKLVYFDILHDGNLAIPTYHKASFTTIFRTITKGKHGDRQIKDLLDRMEAKGKYEGKGTIDMFIMDSATKVGNRSKFYVLDDKFENFNDLSNIDVYTQPFSGLRRQLITDAHDVDRTKTGTQFLKIAFSNLFLDEEVYEIDNKKVTGNRIKDIAFACLNNLSDRGRQEVEELLGYSNGKINKKKLIELLAEDAKKSNASDNLVDVLSMDGDNMYLELDSLTERKWIQSRLISLISKFTIDIKLPGNQLIQFSNLGMRSINKNYTLEEELKGADKHYDWIQNATDDLPFLRKDKETGKVISMGCIVSINLFKHIIPNYDNISYEEKLKFLRDNPDVIGYRIPTQGQNSIFTLKVMGVYPETIGDTVTLPAEFTTLTGSDFDIDKIYLIRYNYVNVGNRLKKVKFIDIDTNNEEELKKVYASRYNTLKWKLQDLEKIDTDNLQEREIDILSSIVDLTDDKAVEDAILKIRTHGKWDLESLNKLREANQRIPTEEAFIAKYKGKSIYEVNSRKAVENRLIDTIFSVMQSSAHFDSVSSPLGDLTGRLKKKAAKIREASEKARPDMYYLSPRFNETIKHIYTGGLNGVGPFALNNTHHVLAQLAGLKMKGSFGEVMYLDDDNNIDLSKHRGKDDIFISNWISALIDAHVDVAKDPYIMDLNCNSYTYNVIALLLRGGVGGENTFDFVAQPILKELANEALLSDTNKNSLTKTLEIQKGLDDDNQPNIVIVNDPVEYIRSKWSSKLTEEDLEKVKQISVSSVFNTSLPKDLLNTDLENKEFIIRQLVILNAFIELKERGSKLNTLVQASQIDTKRFGSNITELRVFLNRIRKAFEDNAFVNIDKILPFDPDSGEIIPGGNFLGTYAANAIKFSLDIFSDISIYGTPVFGELFDRLANITGNKITTDSKFVNMLSDEIFSAIVSKFYTSYAYAGIDSHKLDVLMEAAARRLSDIVNNKDGLYTDLKDNAFLKYLYLAPTPDDIQNVFPMHITIPMKSAKDKLDKDSIIYAYKELLKDSRADVRALARQLFYYAFFTSGFRSRIYSFFNMLPNEMFKEISIKDPNNPKSIIDRSYNEMIKQILLEMKNDSNSILYSNIIDEVIINNHDNNNIVKIVKGRAIDRIINTYKGKSYPHNVGIVLSDRIAKKYFLGTNHNGSIIYRPYTKIYDKELGHIILRYVGYIAETSSYGKKIYKPVYVTQNMRGYNKRGTVLREFNLNKSIIPAYNELNIIKSSMEKDFLATVADTNEFVYVPKNEQYVLMDQPEVVTEDETIDEQSSINFKTVEDEKVASKEEGKREGQRKRVLTTAPVSLSTKDNPLVIFVDGSDIDKQSADNKIGYGAWLSYNGRDYGLSGTKTDVDRILSQFKDMKMSNPTMEMLGLLEVLNRFKTTKEHIVVRQDYSGAVNYGSLWDHSEGSMQRANKPWVAKEPYIKYLVEEISKAIKQLEDNGGSIRMQWVPGHIDSNKISKYPDIFKDSNGVISQSIIDQLTKGNDSADTYAKMQESKDNIGDLFYPFGESEIKTEIIESRVTLKPEEVIDHSGGATGADSTWEDYGREYGVVQYKHYYHGNKTPRGNIEITNEELEEGWKHVIKANKTLNRKPNAYKDLLSRNWMQVKNADEVFAISNIDLYDNIVKGGTGWAVQMAIDAGKIAHVFDQTTNHWYITEYDEDNDFMGFAEEDTPILTKNFAGIGTRIENLTQQGKQAIKDVYEKTFALRKSESDMFGQLSLFDKTNDITDEQAKERKKECE